jgi:alkaline phosphatase
MVRLIHRMMLTGMLLFSCAAATTAQTIYPLDRADILSGSKFDFKVEFPGVLEVGAIKVTINGRDAAEVLGKPATFIAKEDGLEHSAYWIRDVSIAMAGLMTIVAEAGDKSARVTWSIYPTPSERNAKNVILFIGDGMSIAHRTAARVLSKGIKEGKYGGDLAIDDMPHMALISTSGSDAIITDSANSMSAYTTGHKSCTNALGVYCALNKSSLDHPKVETVGELVKRRARMALGVVTTTEIEDATPAGIVAHTRRRLDFNDIVGMFYSVQPEVMLGGGTPHFWPKSKEGSKRTDEIDYIAKFKDAGYVYASTATELMAAGADPATSKILGLFNNGNLDGALDRRILKKGTVSRYPDQPDLVDQTKIALQLLSKSDNGFMLMVESGRIDKYTHSLDWERAVFDTIMLDNAVQAAKDWAANRNDTLIIVVPDHAHPVSIVGTYDDDRPGMTLRDKLGIYNQSKFPNYPVSDVDGYPSTVDVSRRLAFVYGAYPDHCTSGKPSVAGENRPTEPNATKTAMIANEQTCTAPGAARFTGNLPFTASSGVHAADDVLLTAMGPGAELFRGRMDNTAVFRVIATALALGEK